MTCDQERVERSTDDRDDARALRAALAAARYQLTAAERERDFVLDVLSARTPHTVEHAAAVAVIAALQRYSEVYRPAAAVSEWIDVMHALAEYRRLAVGQ